MSDSIHLPYQCVIPPSENIPNKLLLSEWSLPGKIVKGYLKQKIETMFKWQYDCLTSKGVLTGKNLIVCAPTGAGKTLVAELLALKCVFEKKKKVIMIVPFVSIAQEKVDYLTSLFETSIRVGGFMGIKYPQGGFSSVEIAVCTIERANGLVNELFRTNDVTNVGLVIVDELHMIGDKQRGPLLELILTKFLYCRQKDSLKFQVMGISLADVDMNLLSTWLDAHIHKTKCRPIPLEETVLLDTTFHDKDLNKFTSEFDSELVGMRSDISTICQKHLLEEHSVLIFCPYKKECEVLARRLAMELQKRIAESMKTVLNVPKLNSICDQLNETPAGLDEALKETIPNGIAYHHADLTFEERKIVENGFRQMHIKIIVSTTTLSAGVNLPAHLVIVTNYLYQYQVQLDTLVYKQMVGRAGRKGFDKEGKSILMCKAYQEGSVATTIKSIPTIKSSFSSSKENLSMDAKDNCLQKVLLEVIASGIVSTMDEVMQYFSTTLFCIGLKYVIAMSDPVNKALKFLVKNKFILFEDNGSDPNKRKLKATLLGKATMSSVLSPGDAISVFNAIEENAMNNSIPVMNEELIYLVIPKDSLDEWLNVDWNKYYSEWILLSEDVKKVSNTLNVTESYLARAKMNTSISIPPRYLKFFMCMALQKLILKVPIMEVSKTYGVTKGHLQRLRNTVVKSAHMVARFCKNFESDHWKTLERALLQLYNILSKDSPRVPVLKTARKRSPQRASPQAVTPPSKKLKHFAEDPVVSTSVCTRPRTNGQICTSFSLNNRPEECNVVTPAPLLTDNDIAAVLTMVQPASTVWFNIGLQLGIPCSELEEIEKESSKESVCLRKMLVFWLRNGSNRSWKALAEAMGSDLVRRKDIGEKILKEKC